MRTKSILQREQQCYITGSRVNLDCHHVYHGTSNRKLSDIYGCWVWLNHDVHMRLHGGDRELDLRLKRECQEAFEAIYGREVFVQVFGKSYLEG